MWQSRFVDFYERGGQKISLFIIVPDDVDVEMEEMSSYSISMSGAMLKSGVKGIRSTPL
jgi:hypothetical protein